MSHSYQLITKEDTSAVSFVEEAGPLFQPNVLSLDLIPCRVG